MCIQMTAKNIKKTLTKTVDKNGKLQRAGWVKAGMSRFLLNITSEFQAEIVQSRC